MNKIYDFCFFNCKFAKPFVDSKIIYIEQQFYSEEDETEITFTIECENKELCLKWQ